MSATTTEKNAFTKRVNEQLSELKAAMDQVRDNFDAVSTGTAENLRARRAQVQTAVEARRQSVDEAGDRLKARAKATKAETEAMVASWRANREVHQLEERAKDAEDHAHAALVVARGAIEKANAAILEAVGNRRDADEANQGPTKA